MLRLRIVQFYALEALRAFWLTLPITTIYYLLHFTIGTVGAFEAVLACCVFLFEIPSGILSDRVGHRAVAGTGLLLYGGALILLGSLSTRAWFLIGFALWGVAEAAISGAYQAATYEHASLIGANYRHLRTTSGIVRGVCVVIGSLLGAALFSIRPGLPFVSYGIVLIAAAALTFTLRGTSRSERTAPTTIGIVRAVRRPKLGRIFWYSIVAFGAIQAFVVLLQRPILVTNGFSASNLGWIMALLFGLGWASQRVLRHEHGGRAGIVLSGLIVAVALAFTGLLSGLLVLLPLVAFRIAREIQDLQVELAIQSLVPDHVRASVFSVQSSIGNLFQAALVLGTGALAQRGSLSGSLLPLAGIITIAAIALGAWPGRVGRHERSIG